MYVKRKALVIGTFWTLIILLGLSANFVITDNLVKGEQDLFDFSAEYYCVISVIPPIEGTTLTIDFALENKDTQSYSGWISFRVKHELITWNWETTSLTIDPNGIWRARLKIDALESGTYWFYVTLRVNEIPFRTFPWSDAFPVMRSGDAAAWAGVIIAAIGLLGYVKKDAIKRFLKNLF